MQNSHVWILQGYAYLHWLMSHSKIWCIGALAFYHCCIKMWSCLLLHWLPNISQVQCTYLLNFLPPMHHFLSLVSFFIRSLHGPSAHSTFKPWESDVPTPTLWMWVTYQKAVGALALDHLQGSRQGHNILFCHTHKAKMPSSQQTRAYCNAMSQSNIKGKRCTNSNSVNGGDLSKGCRGTLGHVQGSPQGCNISFCHGYKAHTPLSQWLEPITM